MAKVELTKEQELKLKRLMAQGRSKGEALVEMGLYTKREEVVVEPVVAKKERKAKAPDPEKQALINVLRKALEDNGNFIGDVTTREINFSVGSNSYTLSLVKHKAIA